MPVIRPNLNLNSLPPKFTSVAVAQTKMPTPENLKANLNLFRDRMKNMERPLFREDCFSPSYKEIQSSGFATMSQGFFVSNIGDDAFIHARREMPQCQGEFDGEKFHISVQSEHVEKAFGTLSGLLFSEDSPIDKWKITDMDRADSQSRGSASAQFTLYVKPDRNDSSYTESFLHKTRSFVEEIELRLSENDVPSGQLPESDVKPANWKYVSYRNELRSQREGCEAQSQQLRQEPFYRLMTE